MSPVAGPLALSQAPWNPGNGGHFGEIRTPNHSSSPSSRISSARLASIASHLTPTDHAVLDVVARTRLCSGAQLERLFWSQGEPGSRARKARRSLRRLTGWRI